MDRSPAKTVELLLASDLYVDVLAGAKTMTIREGIRDINPGDRLYIVDRDTDESYRTEVRVVEKYREFDDVSLATLNADGFESWAAGLMVMRRFYPDFDGVSPVTVVRW